MTRYTKLNSKYILAKRHQTIEQGTLYERDWTTIGNVHHLEPGKRPFYGDGNFLFTENTFPVYKKKRKTGAWVGEYTYEDVRNATDIVNLIRLNTNSENLTDYAYWGSATELFRGSVEHIIETFPGMLRSTKQKFMLHIHLSGLNNGVEYWEEAPGYILSNPFGLDMYEQFEDVDDEYLLRYIALSWRNYVLEDYDNGTTSGITYYDVREEAYQYDCEGRFFKIGNIVIFSGEYSFVVDVYRADGEIVYCYRTNEESVEFMINYFSGLNGNSNNTQRNQNTARYIESETATYALPQEFSIHPNENVINDYFENLSGFEWKLLNRTTKPLYQNIFLFPSQNKNGNWSLVRRKYTWPSEGYCIDIESTDYDAFINSMASLCETYDNLWCDSIWRCMVHESVKNFDWSYRREYEDNDAEENIEGGNRMKDVMRLYGIFYDTAKRYVDGISLHNNITYDGYNNCPSAQISDRNNLIGWDITSTQHQFYWYDELPVNPGVEGIVSLPAVPTNVDDNSPEYISVTCSTNADSIFYKKNTMLVTDINLDSQFFELTIPSESEPSEDIPVVEKQENPWIPTNSYDKTYVEVGYSEIPDGYDFTDATYNEYPYMLFEDASNYPDYVQVITNNGTTYYKLLSGNEIEENNEQYVHDKWFPTKNEKTITTETTDILFNRTLNLSANRILKTKGTKEAVEMVMALFGFGLYDEDTNPCGDFIMDERYMEYTPMNYDEKFYFYEEIDENDVKETPVYENGDIVSYLINNGLPTSTDPEYMAFTTTGTPPYTYYRLNGNYTVYDTIKMLYAHRTTERSEEDSYYAGVPIKDVFKGNSHLIVPFYNFKKHYEGNMYFESKGGWMKNGDETVDTWEYSETIPYLHILQTINDLFLLDTSDANDGDIYFVADVSNYYEYVPDVPYYLSNFFKLKDKYNSSMFSSWVNIPIEGPIQFGYSGIDGVTFSDYKHAKHLNEIIPMVLFNNPHCGYDRYDMGADYKQYMQFPYTYSVETYQFDDEFYRNMASQFYFAMDTVYGEKIGIDAETYRYSNNNVILNDSERQQKIKGNDKYLKITLITDDNTESHRMHLEYMRNVVMKYVAQVIPSTTLLVLENFVPNDTMSHDFATITTVVNGNGTVYGAGTYLKSSMVTLKAVAEEGYHFDRWTWTDVTSRANDSVSYNDELNVMVCGDKTYTAWFVEDCGMTYGCETLDNSGNVNVTNTTTHNETER